MTEKPRAYDAYQELAQAYAEKIDTKPHNAYYDRPAMLGLLPDVAGRQVFDAGCGPGAYAEALQSRGAIVTACDMSERMLELAKQRLESQLDEGTVKLICLDLARPLSMFGINQFDVVNAPLCLDYIEDWRRLFNEFYRILKPGGCLVFSCGHPAFEAEYFSTQSYFSIEAVECTWTGFGPQIRMPSFRRSLDEITSPVIEAGFRIERIHEPLPTQEFKRADPVRYKRLKSRPAFLCIRASK